MSTDERDEVDELVAAWQRERPDLDHEPMQVWSRITRLAELIAESRAAAFVDHGLQAWEFDVLAALRRSGPPYQLSPGRLSRATHVTSGTMTNRINRLAARGLVVRQTDPHDGRGVLVELTDQGRARVDAALGELLQAESVLLEQIPADQRDALTGLLRELLLAQSPAESGEAEPES